MTLSQTDIKPVDRWIPWMFVAFFLTFISVDAVMVTLAVRTHPGLVTEGAYEKGLAYNHTLDEAARQKEWGWHNTIQLENRNLIFSLSDKQSSPIKGAVVSARITRPVQDGHDFTINLTESPHHTYEAELPLPMPGEWNVRIFAKWQNRQYQASQTVLAP